MIDLPSSIAGDSTISPQPPGGSDFMITRLGIAARWRMSPLPKVVADFMIYLALTHDWELRGDGSGDIEEIQFAPLRRLLKIYEKFGARTTFLPDVMQQITFRNRENDHPELKPLA